MTYFSLVWHWDVDLAACRRRGVCAEQEGRMDGRRARVLGSLIAGGSSGMMESVLGGWSGWWARNNSGEGVGKTARKAPFR